MSLLKSTPSGAFKVVLLILFITVASTGFLLVKKQSPRQSTHTDIKVLPSIQQPPSAANFTIEMPIFPSDVAFNAFGLLPFGVHIADHGLDGHPGWDIEYKKGASVRVAADGEIQSIFADPKVPNDHVIQIQHTVGNKFYRTVYGHIGTIAPEIVKGATVKAGQPLGSAIEQNRMIGRTPVSYSMIHFQIDDFSKNKGKTNVNAVNPGDYLSVQGVSLFEKIWQTARYSQEIVEPFPHNERDISFPQTVHWKIKEGNGVYQIKIKRADGATSRYEYEFISPDGARTETGEVSLDPLASPFSTIDFLANNNGPVKLGIYDIVNETMRLSMGNGEKRPSNFSTVSLYTIQ